MVDTEKYHSSINAENERITLQRRAQNNLKKAKALEAERLASGWKWITEGKTARLVSPEKLQESVINEEHNQITE